MKYRRNSKRGPRPPGRIGETRELEHNRKKGGRKQPKERLKLEAERWAGDRLK